MLVNCSMSIFDDRYFCVKLFDVCSVATFYEEMFVISAVKRICICIYVYVHILLSLII